ncbi:hypothetical protein JB92DRAFT_1113564 [Gautieria morchelliformis]|nr:hypothetical protein JB92DRAFT_1113564 [Gautieria morchelliformis]
MASTRLSALPFSLSFYWEMPLMAVQQPQQGGAVAVVLDGWQAMLISLAEKVERTDSYTILQRVIISPGCRFLSSALNLFLHLNTRAIKSKFCPNRLSACAIISMRSMVGDLHHKTVPYLLYSILSNNTAVFPTCNTIIFSDERRPALGHLLKCIWHSIM